MDVLLPDYGNLQRRLVLGYMNFSYRLGAWLDRREFERLSRMLYQADVDLTPGMFMSVCFLSAFLVGALMFIASGAALTFLGSMMSLSLALLVGSASAAAVVAGFAFYLINLVNVKKVEIERDLPFALSYMSILASAGSTPLKVIASVSIQGYGHISKEFQKMGYRVYFLGEDSITAMNNLATNTPSSIFRDTCFDLSNIIHSGSGLSEYLAERSDDLVNLKRLAMREFIESISVFAELYMMLTMFTIMAIIGIPLVGMFGLQIASLSADSMFIIFTYLLLPFANILFLAMLEMRYSSIP